MNVSNAAYFKPLTINTPSLQKEGYDPSREGEEPWYAPEEKVVPRVYHKYLKASDLENIYGKEEEEPDEGEGGDGHKDDEEEKPKEEEPKTEEPKQPIEPEPQQL